MTYFSKKMFPKNWNLKWYVSEIHRKIFSRKYFYLPTDIEPFNIIEKKSK